MRKKEMSSSVKWTDKNKLYLAQLGMIDGRTGKALRNMSGFINECVTIVLESSKHPKTQIASSDELRKAWIKYAVAERNKKIRALKTEIIDLINKDQLEKQFNNAIEKQTELS